jgi:hypothetical protein
VLADRLSVLGDLEPFCASLFRCAGREGTSSRSERVYRMARHTPDRSSSLAGSGQGQSLTVTRYEQTVQRLPGGVLSVWALLATKPRQATPSVVRRGATLEPNEVSRANLSRKGVLRWETTRQPCLD